MLTKLILKNFKRFENAEIDLGKSVVFIGPNNSGKTTALQSLALWDVGLRSWLAKRGGKASPEKRPGVAINRRDLISVPVPVANLLWHGLHTRNMRKENGKTVTNNIRIEVSVEGITADAPWSCGFEFDYSNEESFVCRPCRLPEYQDSQVSRAKFSRIPLQAESTKVAYLPPMSGLADREHLKQPGEIDFLVGQGRTAEVLRNLCRRVYDGSGGQGTWGQLVEQMRALFGVELLEPVYVAERSEITMQYEQEGVRLDLSSAGRGLQQTLLLLAHLYANPKTILLLDEPDAHLEILRQRQIYQLLSDVADRQGSQIIAASHSEVVLNEAAGRGKVIAFVGSPHTMNDRGSQVMKSLTDIGWDLYYQAEERGWILFLEGATDLEILRTFAMRLGHPAAECLQSPFVHYVSTNLPNNARNIFFGLREAKPDLAGIAIFDRLETSLQSEKGLRELMWSRRELENYLCSEDVLMAYASSNEEENLFTVSQEPKRQQAMRAAIDEMTTALAALDKPSPWSVDIKATDDFLDPLFKSYFRKLKLPITFRKADYHQLARFVAKEHIDPEITLKLDAIYATAKKAKPRK
ncbi:MAG: AAA family ATPase [Phycisphaerae bacterium]